MFSLSICIPTYNRSDCLRQTIESIVSQPEFTNTDEVEIVISDNCSTDDTGIVAREFVDRYPSKIKYHRNEVNIVDSNFEKVLSLGSGTILKLNNDTLVLNPGSLSLLLETTHHCIKNNYIPFLPNGEMRDYSEAFVCKDICEFVSKVSYYSTWIGAFCIPRDVFHQVEDFSRDSALQLVQVDVLMKLLKAGYQFSILPNKISTSIFPGKKGGYNLPKVFLTNYFKILGNFLTSPEEIDVLKKEKRKILFKFVLPWFKNIYKDSLTKKPIYFFQTAGYKDIIKKEFSFFTYVTFESKLFLSNCVQFSFNLLKIVK